MADATKLEAVLDYIRMHPEEHNQSQWAEKTPCGTAMCFAGTAVRLAGYEMVWEKSIFAGEETAFYCKVPDGYAGKRVGRVECNHLNLTIACIHDVASHELGLDYDEAHELFWESDTFAQVEETVKDIINNNPPAA